MKKIPTILAAIGIAATSSQAAIISLDNSAAALLNSTTLSGFTVNGANTHRMLLVSIAGENGTAISGITYGTSALTPVAVANEGGTASFSQIWILDGVAGGTDTITINGLSGSNGFQFGAISLYSTEDLVISDSDTNTSAGSNPPASLSMNIETDDFVFTMGQANFDTNISTTSLTNNLFNYSIGGAGFSFSADYENNPGAGDIVYDWTRNNNRYALAGVVVSAVPEPSSAALLGLGSLALILRRRR